MHRDVALVVAGRVQRASGQRHVRADGVLRQAHESRWLEQRGRESRDDILRRLERSALCVDGDFDVITVDNSGAIEDAGRTMMELLEQSVRNRI